MTAVPEAPAASDHDGAEVERLRAEVASLRSRLGQRNQRGEGPVAQTGQATRQWWRTVLASLLIVLACVLAPLSAVAVWTKNQVTNTDRYLRTMAPLASEPAIQRALADRITAKIFATIDVKGLTDQAVDALAKQGLPPNVVAQLRSLEVPVANGVQSFTHSEIAKITSSAAFATAWVQANRFAHDALVKALTGKGGGAVTIQNDTVTLNLGPLIHTVKQQLTASGFSLAAKIPETNATFVLFQSSAITKAQSGFNLLNTLGIWLPIIVLALIALGVYVAKSHRRALVGACLGVGAGMIVLALGLAIFRSAYLSALPPNVSHDAAAVAYDTLVRFLRLGLRAVLVLALVIALGAFLTGPSVTAVRTREAWYGGSAGCGVAPNRRVCAPGQSGPGCTSTSRRCVSAPSRPPGWRWCSGASPPGRSSSCSPCCCWSHSRSSSSSHDPPGPPSALRHPRPDPFGATASEVPAGPTAGQA